MKKMKTKWNKLLIALLILIGSANFSYASCAHAFSSQGDCWRWYGQCMWAIVDRDPVDESDMPVTFTLTSSTVLVISYQRALGESDDETINLSSSVSIPETICATLGVTSITIAPGTYTPDYSLNANGDLIVNVTVTK